MECIGFSGTKYNKRINIVPSKIVMIFLMNDKIYVDDNLGYIRDRGDEGILVLNHGWHYFSLTVRPKMDLQLYK